MRKWVKRLASLVGVLVLVCIVGIIVLTTMVDPNRFKPLIVERLTKYTGHEVSIDQNLSWSFFPSLGLKFDHVVINSASSAKNKFFADITNLVIGVKLLPLLAGNIESDELSIRQIKLEVVTHSSDKTKQPVNSAAAQNSNTLTEKVTIQHTQKNDTGLLHLGRISKIDIDNANISWHNLKTNKAYHLNHAEIHAKDIQLDHDFPLEVRTILTDKKLKTKVSVEGNVLIALNKQSLSYRDIKAYIGDIAISGSVEVQQFKTQPLINVNLNIHPFNLPAGYEGLGLASAQLPTANKVRSNIQILFSGNNLSGQAQLYADNLQSKEVSLSNLEARLAFNNNVLTMKSISAKIYQGQVSMYGQIDLTKQVPVILLDGTLKQIHLNDLQKEKTKLAIYGLVNAEFHVTTIGNPKYLLPGLNGKILFNVSNGAIGGIDVDYLIDGAYSLATNKVPTLKNTNQTKFNMMQGTAQITNGVVNNQDLQIKSELLDITGKGSINLMTKKIDYTLLNGIKKHTNEERDAFYNLYGATIPVLLKGSISQPNIILDTNTIFKMIADRQMQRMKEKAQDKVKKEIKEQLQGHVPDSAAEMIVNLLDNKN